MFSMPCRSKVSLLYCHLFQFMPSLCIVIYFYFVILQGDGDYELVKEIVFDDYLRARIAKVKPCSTSFSAPFSP